MNDFEALYEIMDEEFEEEKTTFDEDYEKNEEMKKNIKEIIKTQFEKLFKDEEININIHNDNNKKMKNKKKKRRGKLTNYNKRKGDWLCDKCLNINFNFRIECNICKAKKT